MSKNCLITRIKADVNDDSLPVVETMQQFTLNAIAASGNESMTYAQKWALNRFFYQIGAIDNAGIFAKMDYIFLPAICNKVMEKALVNYKDNTTAASSTTQYEFVGNGIKKNAGVSGNFGNLIINNNYAIDQGDYTFAYGCYPSVENFIRITSQMHVFTSKVDSSISDKPAIFLTEGTKEYHYFRGFGYDFLAALNNFNGVVCSFKDGTQKATFAKDTYDDVDGSLFKTVTLGSAVSFKLYFSELPIGVIMLGKGLTTEERHSLAIAINSLINAFRV